MFLIIFQSKNTYLICVLTLGLTQWNLNSFEFKFDDTRLSSWYKNKIGLIETLFCCFLTLLCLCPVGCLSLEKFSWDSQQGRDRATSGSNKIKFQSDQYYSYIIRKVWYHQIRIQTYLGFIVLILIYILLINLLLVWFFGCSIDCLRISISW